MQICRIVENVLLLFLLFLCSSLYIPAVGTHGQATLLTIYTTLNNYDDFVNSVNTRSVNTNSRLIQISFVLTDEANWLACLRKSKK